MDVEIGNRRKCLRKKRSLSLFGERQFLLQSLPLLDAFDHFHPFQNISRFDTEPVQDSLVQSRQRMHLFRAVQVQDAENRWRVRLRRYSHQRHTCYGAQIHCNNAGLLFVPVIQSLNHEDRSAFLDHIPDDRVAGFEMGERQISSLTIHTGGVAEILAFPHQNESTFGAADFQ